MYMYRLCQYTDKRNRFCCGLTGISQIASQLELQIFTNIIGRVQSKPAAKCNGVDFLPAMSLAFTFTESTSLLTRETSPLRQASKSSRKAPPVAQMPSPGLVAPEPGLGLVLQLLAAPMFVWELLLLQRGLARAVEAVGISGESGVGSILLLHS